MNAKVVLPILIVASILLGWWVQPLLTGKSKAPRRSTPPGGPKLSVSQAVPEQPTAHSETADNQPPAAVSPYPDGQDVYAFKRVNPTMPESLRLRTEAATAGILIDPQTRQILWAKREHELVPIASMTKLMTLYMTTLALRPPTEISLNDPVTVSAAAASMGGTQVWLAPREVFPLGDLVTAMMVESANDAAYAVGEYLGNGDIETFIAGMNRQARMVGMRKARFYNAHGLPGASLQQENRATCVDMAVLALELQKYPLALQFCGTVSAEFLREGRDPLPMRNKNMLLGTVDGITGMKTGFSRRAGFCLTATAYRDDVLLIAVVTGFGLKADRSECVEQLLDWGYQVRQP